MPELPATVVHFVDRANWPAVQRHGLLRATTLMRAARLDDGWARRHRPASVTLASGAVIRDQRPMPPAALERCLDPPLTAADWYALVNDGVYFWTDVARSERHARVLRGRPQLALTLAVDRLVQAYRGAAFVTPFNIGSAMRRPAARGLRSLVRVERWQQAAWADEASATGKPRPVAHPPAELVIRADIPDVMDFVERVDAIDADGSPQVRA